MRKHNIPLEPAMLMGIFHRRGWIGVPNGHIANQRLQVEAGERGCHLRREGILSMLVVVVAAL
jgi:hypothetical protein